MRLCAVALVMGALLGSATAQAPDVRDIRVYPATIRLDDKADRHRVIVVARHVDGTTREVTAEAEITLATPALAALDASLTLVPAADGETTLRAVLGAHTAEAKLIVANVGTAPEVSFANDVVPVLTRAGCNAGTCHGAAAGKNGFHLSLFGFDKAKDHRQLTRDLRGRRLNAADPDGSLMLLKPTTGVAHKGGKRLARDSSGYRVLRDWIAHGATSDLDAAPKLTGVEIRPEEAVLVGQDQRQRLVVTARYDDGSDRDVTHLALLSSSNDVTAKIDDDGVVTSGERGESFVMARFGTFAVVSQILVLPADLTFDWPDDAAARNYIDEGVHDKLRKMRIGPAAVCDDATFLRRAYLDILNVLPTPDEAQRFLTATEPDKRTRVVDELLDRPEFPDVWAMQWAEILRVESEKLERKGMYVYTDYLRQAFRANKPLNEMVRDLLTSTGSNFTNPASNFYVVERDSKAIAENVAQVFMGVRIQCAQCHNHPFERWTMDDYYGFTAFFTQIGNKRGEDPRERVIYERGSGDIRNPVTNAVAKPKFLGGAVPEIKRGEDPRAAVAEWLVSVDNPFFATNIANRVFARFFGRGVVDPPDDVRVSNPPSHPELHRRLGTKLIEYGYDLRKLIRDICTSRTYQVAAHPDSPPAATFAGAPIRRLTAEQLLDGISQVTEVATKYSRLPLGARATELANGRTGNRFLDIFGRPERKSASTCDRSNEPTLSQVLHLINGSTVTDKLRSDQGRLKRMLKANAKDEEILEALYLAAYSRPPTDTERKQVLATLADQKRGEAWEDLFWAVLNSKEFLFNH